MKPIETCGIRLGLHRRHVQGREHRRWPRPHRFCCRTQTSGSHELVSGAGYVIGKRQGGERDRGRSIWQVGPCGQ